MTEKIFKTILRLLRSLYLFFLISLSFLNKAIKRFEECNILVWSEDEDDVHRLCQLESYAPQHITFVFTEKNCLDLDFIFSIIRCTLLAGIKQLTFCDPWNHTTNLNIDENFAEKFAALNVKFTSNLIQLDELKERPLQIYQIDAKKSQNTLVDICKSLCKMETPLETDDVVHILRNNDVLEPDFLVMVGSDLHIGYGCFPPWALCTTELHSINKFFDWHLFPSSQYCALIHAYIQRQRRFGR